MKILGEKSKVAACKVDLEALVVKAASARAGLGSEAWSRGDGRAILSRFLGSGQGVPTGSAFWVVLNQGMFGSVGYCF